MHRQLNRQEYVSMCWRLLWSVLLNTVFVFFRLLSGGGRVTYSDYLWWCIEFWERSQPSENHDRVWSRNGVGGRAIHSSNPDRVMHDDVIKWKHFPRDWPFVRGIHRSPVNSPHKGQWRGALMFSLICVWIKDWVNNRDLRRYLAHYDVIVMESHRIHVQCKD